MVIKAQHRSDRNRTATFALVAPLLLLITMSGIIRLSDTGNDARIEAQLARYLSVGGSMSDLCKDGECYCPGCLDCDTYCGQTLATQPLPLRLPGVPCRLARSQTGSTEPCSEMAISVAYRLPVRGPPAHT